MAGTDIDEPNSLLVDEAPSQDETLVGGASTTLPDAANLLEFFGDASIPVVLMSLGLAFAGVAIGARLEDTSTWCAPEFLGTLGFGALLVILGCLERLIQMRSERRILVIKRKPIAATVSNRPNYSGQPPREESAHLGTRQ